LIFDDKTVPASLTRNINSAGGQYDTKKKIGTEVFVSRSVTKQSLSNLDGN
jgi:hypothetical protein